MVFILNYYLIFIQWAKHTGLHVPRLVALHLIAIIFLWLAEIQLNHCQCIIIVIKSINYKFNLPVLSGYIIRIMHGPDLDQ